MSSFAGLKLSLYISAYGGKKKDWFVKLCFELRSNELPIGRADFEF